MITHSKSSLFTCVQVPKIAPEANLSCSEECSTDCMLPMFLFFYFICLIYLHILFSFYPVEDYYATSSPFDCIRLRTQILSGQGKVYKYITEIPESQFSKTLVITDSPCVTGNYLFSVARGIPIYQHGLIVDCCLKVMKYIIFL